jgi:alpha-mannosidase
MGAGERCEQKEEGRVSEGDRQVIVHMVGNAHIDPIWLWTQDEGRAEVLASYRTAASLLRAFEGYAFTSGATVTYRWVAEDDPALFEEIRAAVAAGRWNLVTGWWVQPDCNLPAGESFARHALYGQRYLEAVFGRRARIGYCVDSFGHAGTLPQLLRLGGLDSYVFFRPGPQEKELPVGPFWWEGPDGSRVVACRPPLHYGTPGDVDMAARIAAAASEGTTEALPLTLCFYGVGNHGGGPTRANVAEIAALSAAGGAVRPIFSSPEGYFAAVRALPDTWPVVRDELQHHARGCYSVLSRVKRENRRAEDALVRAERLAALAAAVAGGDPGTERLRHAWEGVLFSQFHDVLAGTSIRDAYEDVWRLYDAAQDTATEVLEGALEVLGARLRVRDEGRPLMVWNPLPWERSDVVRFSLRMTDWRDDFWGQRYPGPPIVTDAEGRRVPARLDGVELDYNTYVVHIEAQVTLPALGAAVYYVEVPETVPPAEEPAVLPADTIANDMLRLRVDPDTGALASLVDVATGREYLAGPASLPLVIDDPSDTWSHNVDAFHDVIGTFRAKGAAALVAEDGVQQTLRVDSAWGRSHITQEYTLYPRQRMVDVTLTIDWHEQLKMLKLAFPLALSQARVTASAPYGWVERGADGQEEPCQAWVDVSGEGAGGALGVCFINDSKYGYDVLHNTFRLSVLRSPVYAFHIPRRMVPGVTYPYIDQGRQVVRLRLLPHEGAWQAVQPVRQSEAFHHPLIPRRVTPRSGTRHSLSLLRISPGDVVLTVVKMAEDGQRLIVRGYETAGRPARLVISSAALGHTWTHTVRPHEVWTLALPLGGGAPIPLNFLEEPVDDHHPSSAQP